MKKPILILGFVFLLHALLDIYFLTHDKTPQSWDQSGHLFNSVIMFNHLREGNFREAFTSSYFYPPFYYLTTLPIYFFTKTPPFPLFINLAYLAILIFAVYKITAFYFDKLSGITAAILIASYPWIIIQRRNYLLDFPLTAFVALSFYAILATNNFTNRRLSVIAGFIGSVALLTKEFSIIYITPFALYSFARGIKTKQKKESIINIFLFFITMMLISAAWYIPNISSIIAGFHELPLYALEEKDPTGISLSSLLYYFNTIWWQISPILALGAYISLLTFIIYRKYLPVLGGLFFTFLCSYVLITLNPNKDPRYNLPFTILFAVSTSGTLILLKQYRNLKFLIITIVAIFCGIQSFSLSIGIPQIHSQLYTFSIRPNGDNWHINDVVDLFKKNSQSNIPTVLVLPDHPYINFNTLKYYALIAHNPIHTTYPELFRKDPEFLPNLFDTADFIIYKSKHENMRNLTPNYNRVEEAYMLFESKKHKYFFINSFNLSDDSEVSVYKKSTIQ